MASSLATKLKLKEGSVAVILNAPGGYPASLGELPAGVRVEKTLRPEVDWLLAFVKSRKELDALVPHVVTSVSPKSLVWLAFPKGSSAIQTDLTRDQGWEAVEAAQLKWVTLVSLDSTWSAFGVRPLREGEQYVSRL